MAETIVRGFESALARWPAAPRPALVRLAVAAGSPED
jgi:hypothetical protein